jgi:hypothetical protein
VKAGTLGGELALPIGVRFGEMLLKCRPGLSNGCPHAEETQVEREDTRFLMMRRTVRTVVANDMGSLPSSANARQAWTRFHSI